MALDSQLLVEFRSRLTWIRGTSERRWEATRRLVAPPQTRTTLKRLVTAVHQAVLPADLKTAILSTLRNGTADRVQDLNGARLTELTGLPPTKAIRALSLLFGLIEEECRSLPIPTWNSSQVEQFARDHQNPFDILLDVDIPSLLDLGAGDLSFASELVDHYLPLLSAKQQSLTLHCLDRLDPQSKLGGPLHVERNRLVDLQGRDNLLFQFWGDQDMFDLSPLDRANAIAARYALVTCWAPATPTFAYEPTRLTRQIIAEHLRHFKGAFQTVRVDGEVALEVQHSGRSLLFPPWKFDIRGPLSLLDEMTRRSLLGVLGAVDTQVFWEILSQLLADPCLRPRNEILPPEHVAHRLGSLVPRLTELPLGHSLVLSDVAELRKDIPRVLERAETEEPSYRFRYVEVRRGAVFQGMPASSTARRFKDMTEETPPWFLLLVPDHPV